MLQFSAQHAATRWLNALEKALAGDEYDGAPPMRFAEEMVRDQLPADELNAIATVIAVQEQPRYAGVFYQVLMRFAVDIELVAESLHILK